MRLRSSLRNHVRRELLTGKGFGQSWNGWVSAVVSPGISDGGTLRSSIGNKRLASLPVK